MCIQVSARQENHSEDPIDHVQDPAGRVTESEDGESRHSLDPSEAGHDQEAGAKSAAHLRVTEVAIRAPQTEQHGENDQRIRADPVDEKERIRQLMGAQHLLAEIVDGQAKAFLELDPWLPAEFVERARIVEGDSKNVALF